MDNKVRIGGQSADTERADKAERDSVNDAAALTFIRRRIRTFYQEVTEVSFPEDAPSWAPDWVEWLLTGELAKPEVESEAETPETAEITVETPAA